VALAHRRLPTPTAPTPLHQAVRQNDLKTVEAQIKKGADVKAATRYGVTPIGLAALNGNAAIPEAG
jgi:ankyrin repeat protein